jgi:hypothetical protein
MTTTATVFVMVVWSDVVCPRPANSETYPEATKLTHPLILFIISHRPLEIQEASQQPSPV